jgi:thiol-disulfide isomerase/thioredoxin/copper chaperone CopZ
VVLAALAVARPAAADRVQVFSVQGIDCAQCENEIRPYLKKVKGVKKWTFDLTKSEFTITLADNTPDSTVIAAIERAGSQFRALPGAGQGTKLGASQHAPYPDGADFAVVTDKGDAVGPLEGLRVPGKYTVFDYYADWCGPCAKVDRLLREIVGTRKDVAIRKLNVVSFNSPLAKQLGRRLRGLPYVVVFSPDGKRTEIIGENYKQLRSALDVRK